MSSIPLKDVDPLFLAYGKACYVAQYFESTLRFLLMVNLSHKDEKPLSASAISTIETETAYKALFALFNRAKKVEYFTPEEEKQVKDAMIKRNYIIHEYWSKNMTKVQSPEGRAFITKELDEICKKIWAADNIIVSLIDRYFVEYGFTTEMIKEMSMQRYEAGTLGERIIKH